MTEEGKDVSVVDKLGRMIRGVAHRSDAAAEPESRNSPAPPPAAFDYEDKRVPASARERIRRIQACIEGVDKAMAREQVPGFSRIDMEQMRDIHLPKLVQSYIDIPAEHRSEIFRKTGKSASFVLNESLDKMQARVDEILKNLAQQDIDAFTDNARFIGQRYADEGNPFK